MSFLNNGMFWLLLKREREYILHRSVSAQYFSIIFSSLEGVTSVSVAALYGQCEVVKKLKLNGADPNLESEPSTPSCSPTIKTS